MNIEDFLPKYPFIESSIVQPYDEKDHFNNILYHKKEFYENRLTEDEKFPTEKGQYTKYQNTITRFLSSKTPYNSLLLVHEPGLGKTCSAIGSIEKSRQDNIYKGAIGSIEKSRQDNIYKGAIIFAKGEPLLDNFTKQLVEKCTHGQYIPMNYKESTDLEKTRRIKKKIKYYQLKTFVKFAKQIKDIDDDIIRKNYSDRFIVIDEVHNLRIKERDEEEDIETYKQFHRFLHLVQNCKILLMSGTPMKDSVDEIASVMNLILPMNEQLPTGDDFLKEFTNVEKKVYKIKDAKRDILKQRFLGRISYLKDSVSSVPKEYIGDKCGTLKHFIVEECFMSEFQTEWYKKAYAKDSKEQGGVFLNTGQASLFVYPDGSYGKDGFVKYIKREKVASKTKRGIPDKYKMSSELRNALVADTPSNTIKNIEKHSASYAKTLRHVLDTKGNCFIYCSSVQGSGCILFSLLLELIGFSRASGNERDEKLRYGILTNITTNAGEIKRINNRFNQKDNSDGKFIKLIIGSKAIAEGFSFNNVIFETVLTPWWNYSETSQALARGIRYGSHNDLKNPKVKIMQTVSIPKDRSFSIDLHMYQISEDKDISIKNILRLLMEIAFDCALNYARNRIRGADYSRECDYTVCRYKCDGIDMKNLDLDEKDLDLSTYDIFYSNEKTTEIKRKIEQIYRENINISTDAIIERLNTVHPIEEIVNALTSIQSSGIENPTYVDFLNMNEHSDVQKISNQIEKLFQTNFLLSYNEIKNNFKEYNDFEIISSLNSVINKSVIIRNRFGFPSYLREDSNLYYLVSNIDIQYDFLAEYYTQFPHIKNSKRFSSIIEKYYDMKLPNLVIKLMTENLNEKQFANILKSIPDDIQSMLLEICILANEKGIEKNKKSRERLLLFFKSHITKVKGVWISNLLKKKGITRCLNGDDWEDCDPDFVKKLERLQSKKEEEKRKNNPYGVMGKYNSENKKFCIVDLEKEKEVLAKKSSDKRLNHSGKVCESGWKIPQLIEIAAMKLKIEPPEDFLDYDSNVLYEKIIADKSVVTILEKIDRFKDGKIKRLKKEDKETLRRILYFSRTSKQGGLRGIKPLCAIIQEWMDNNGILEDDALCGVQGKTKKVEDKSPSKTESKTPVKRQQKFTIKVFNANKKDKELKEYLKDIETMMVKCFNDEFKMEYDDSKWVMTFSRKKLVGFLSMGDDGIIWNVCVAEKYRRKGVARSVISQALYTICDNNTVPTLHVDNKKQNAKTLVDIYKKLGFTVQSEDSSVIKMVHVCE